MHKILVLASLLILSSFGAQATQVYKCYIDGRHAFQQLPCPPGTSIRDHSETLDRDVEIREKINEMIKESSQFKAQVTDALISEYAYEGLTEFAGPYGKYKLDIDEGTVTILYDPQKLGLPNVDNQPGSLSIIYTAFIKNNQLTWLCHIQGNSDKYAPSYCQEQ